MKRHGGGGGCGGGCCGGGCGMPIMVMPMMGGGGQCNKLGGAQDVDSTGTCADHKFRLHFLVGDNGSKNHL